MRQQVFRFKQFNLNQTNAPFKLCQDSCILGAFTSTLENFTPHSILDIGTGTGVLALMQAQIFHDANIDAIEINPEVAGIAMANFNSSPWASRLKLHQESFQEFISTNTQRYDLIICNPPFYGGQLLGKEPQRNLALHQLKLDFKTLLNGVNQTLSEKGLFFCLISAHKRSDFDQKLNEFDLHINKILRVAHQADLPIQRLIYCLSKTPSSIAEYRLNIKNSQGNFTSGMKQLLKDFYLIF